MKILIDDKRTVLPDGSIPDAIFKSPYVFEAFCGWNRLARHDEVYLDHDMGEHERTGYQLITELEELFFLSNQPLPSKIVCVSDNAPGRARIQQVIDKLYGGK